MNTVIHMIEIPDGTAEGQALVCVCVCVFKGDNKQRRVVYCEWHKA